MIGEDNCRSILEKALDRSGGEELEAYLQVQDLALTRFAVNSVHQNVSHSNALLHLRAVTGQRQGRATTNDLSDAGIANAVQEARSNSLLMPEDPDFPGLPDSSASARIAAYDEATGQCSPELRAQIVEQVCRRAEAQNLTVAGFCRTGTQEIAVMSTRSVTAYHRSSFAGLLTTATGDTSTGWSKGGSWRLADLDVASLAEEAIDKTLRGRNPRPIEPGEYSVVLDAYAVDDIVGALSDYGMGAQTVQEGRSWMNGLMGEQAMSPQVSIWDDGTDPTGWPVPFDAEGVPRQRVDIVTEGVVREPVHNSYTAGKEGKLSTGHQASFTGGPTANNLFMKEGQHTLEQMIGSLQRGLYITRFFYTRLVHSRGCVMTGMTRDGTFLIENGQLSYPVKDLRFTQSYVEALNRVEAIGSQSKLLLNEGSSCTRVPALQVSGFNFTGVTV
ncbi:MAG: TldD/PmbA family protein [Dehalococcoidia bacterium]